MNITQLIGTSGATLILIAFILNQLGHWRNTDLRYDIVNFIGSILLLMYAVLLKSYPFFILNTVWAVVSLRDIMNTLSYNKKNKKK